jgi:hypothetical protein
MGFNWMEFKWNNNMEGLETIKERLDKALASLPWMDWFVESKVTLYLFIYFFYDSRMSKLR